MLHRRVPMKERIVAAAAGALIIAATALPTGAYAASTPVAGCGEGFALLTVKEIVRTLAAPDFVKTIPTYDANGDGYLCAKVLPNGGGPPVFDPAFVFFDNKAKGQ
jgi:hypothetical protein